MNVLPRRLRTRMVFRVVVSLGFMAALTLASPAGVVLAQIDPQVRDRVLPAAVQIGLVVEVTDDGVATQEVLPVGSGTIVAPHGLILTNWHVVDMATAQTDLDAWAAQTAAGETPLRFTLDTTQLVILTTGSSDVPEPTYLAQVVAEHHALDLAVLQITGDADGHPIAPTSLDLASVPLGDSSALRQGDAIHLFGYPTIGGGTLQYTTGVVSGFNLEDGIDGRAWITTDATMAGGSSGGTAFDGDGRLIGVPTQGTALDCRPGDTNFDGQVDAEDVGCIPIGGSIGQLRPINLARDLLAQAGVDLGLTTVGSQDHTEIADAADEVPAAATQPSPEVLETPSGRAPDEPTPAIDTERSPDGRVLVVKETSPDGGIPVSSPEADAGVEAYCATSPIYESGTRITLPRHIQVRRHGFSERFVVPGGSTIEITDPFIEDGACDWWPIRLVPPPFWGPVEAEDSIWDGTSLAAEVHEWLLRPPDAGTTGEGIADEPAIVIDEEGRDQATQLKRVGGVPLSSLGYWPDCTASPINSPGTHIALPHDTWVWRSTSGVFAGTPGVGGFYAFVPVGTTLEITGPFIDSAEVCDWWPIRFERPPEWGVQGEVESTGDVTPPPQIIDAFISGLNLQPTE